MGSAQTCQHRNESKQMGDKQQRGSAWTERAGGHFVPLNAMAFLAHCPSLSKGGENEEGNGRNEEPTSHLVISQSHLSFCSMPNPGAENTETNTEFSEQRASEERHESSAITSIKSAIKEKARLPKPV